MISRFLTDTVFALPTIRQQSYFCQNSLRALVAGAIGLRITSGLRKKYLSKNVTLDLQNSKSLQAEGRLLAGLLWALAALA